MLSASLMCNAEVFIKVEEIVHQTKVLIYVRSDHGVHSAI